MVKNTKTFLEQLIAAYHELNNHLEESIRAANRQYKEKSSEQVYTEEYLKKNLKQAIDKATADFQAKAADLNTQAKQRITAIKEKLVAHLMTAEKAPDYAVRVGNALSFLQLEGPEITDATAAQILKDFLRDIEIMQRFRSVIERQKGETLTDAYGNTTFPLTFGHLEKCETLFECLADLEKLVDPLFIRKKAETEVEHFSGGLKLSVPMDSYSQQVGELSVVEQAGQVETMAAELTGAAN